MINKTIKFNYNIQLEKRLKDCRIMGYNSPYEDDEKALDDINVMLYGKDLKGNELKNYKTVNWENLDNGKYEINVEVMFISNINNTYDQMFKLINIISK